MRYAFERYVGRHLILDVQIATGNVEHVIPLDDAESKALIETHEHAGDFKEWRRTRFSRTEILLIVVDRSQRSHASFATSLRTEVPVTLHFRNCNNRNIKKGNLSYLADI